MLPRREMTGLVTSAEAGGLPQCPDAGPEPKDTSLASHPPLDELS